MEERMKILVGYDGSNAAKDALDLGIKHAEIFDAKLFVVRSMVGSTSDEAEKVEQARHELEYAEGLCKEKGVECETHLLIRGLKPGEDIILFAEEQKVDEIVIGIHRRSKVGKMVFGSNAQTIILRAPCPVLSIK